MTDAAERKMRFLYALRAQGVTDGRVLAAMESIDRGNFVKGLFAERAYEDTPLPIACGQTISQPSVVALMTQALAVSPRDKVLEIGTGSGYQAAILSQLARRVYTVDRHRRLVREAEAVFAALDLNNITALVGRRQPWPARSGPVRPDPRDRSGRGPARPPIGSASRWRYHGIAGGAVRYRSDPDKGDAGSRRL